jgi:8-oxo-dGTP pyrophosphatase MutT (NUDIX family)
VTGDGDAGIGVVGGAPAWLSDLADAAGRMEVPPPLRPPAEGGRPSAVLVLFGDGPGGPDLLLIERSQELRQHAGQPAFPGGAIDADEGPVAAALREATEEAGVDPSGVDILGALPELFITRSGFRVTPVLAWWRTPCSVAPADTGEVAAVERVRIAEFADPASRLTVRHSSGRTGPGFRVKGMLVWGFTAALVDRLVALGGWEVPWDAAMVYDLPPERAPGTQDRPIRLGSCAEISLTSA